MNLRATGVLLQGCSYLNRYENALNLRMVYCRGWATFAYSRENYMKHKSIIGIFIVFCFWAMVPSKAKPSREARTFARHVPERKGDFAWENDLIAFRAYGPPMRKDKENSGIDCWLKRVNYPIIDKWYKEAKNGKTYHKDHGEGYDPYHVGSSAGCGGTSLWLNGQREPLETYIQYEVIECTPKRSIFKLTYECEIDGTVYGEVKTITIKVGQRLFSIDSVFTKEGKISAGLPVCIGLTTHDGKAEAFYNRKQGWIACWEAIDGSGLGTAARLKPSLIGEIKEVKSKKRDKSHLFILTKTDSYGRLRYQAGYGWEKAGAIKTQSQWKQYLNNI